MDGEPEIVRVIKSDMYAVNEDSDEPEKQEFWVHPGSTCALPPQEVERRRVKWRN